MQVFLVFFCQTYEGNALLGVFSTIEKAKEFEANFLKEYDVSNDWEWTEVRQVEVDKIYKDVFSVIGNEV